MLNRASNSVARMLVKLANDLPTRQKHVILASELLENGGVVALQTDTLYGLCCIANNKDAIRRIYDIKGRNCEKPLAISIGDVPVIHDVACVDHVDNNLLNHLLPGPVTLLFKRGPKLIKDLNPNTSLVGVRIPDHNFIRDICRKVGPLALTSSNKSSEPSSLSVEDFQSIWPQIDCIFDGGKLEFDKERLGSTVVDLSIPNEYRIVRSGCASSPTEAILKSHGLQKMS